MPTPKLPADVIEKLRKYAEEYEQDHQAGPYTASTVRSRVGHANRFIDFLEGRYDPRSDYGKRIVP
jgi:flagellar biosynthesis chaperone FliJ